MKFGIRAQVLIALTLILGFGLLASFWVTSSITTDALVEDHIMRLLHIAPLVSAQLETSDLDEAKLAAALAPARLVRLDATLKARRTSDDSWTKRLRPVAEATRTAGAIRDGFVTRPDGGAAIVVGFPEPQGVAIIISSLDDTRERGATLTRLLLLFTIVILGLAVVPGHVILGRLVVRPLIRLVRVVERIGGGEFTQIHSSGPTPSEVGQLYTALDRMKTQLKKDRDQIRSQLDALTAAHDTLQSTHERLVVSEKLATVGTLAAGVAHEIGNPIAVLQGYIELLADPGLTDEQIATFTAAMSAAVDKASTIIKELLTFARPIEPGEERCDPGQAVRAATRLARYPNLPKGIEMVVVVPQEPLMVAISRGKLEQVLLNLLLNAAQASAEGDEVQVSVSDEAEGIVIRVKDKGSGILEEHRLKVFDPFFTTKEPGQGTGLGLAVCHHIITGHRGTITAERAEPRGACFTIVLPRA